MGEKMIDVHCHILPEIDDGAHDLDESLALCRIGIENGVDKMIVTPHFANVYKADEFIKLRDEKLEKLRSLIADENLPLELYPGCEVFLDDEIHFAPKLDRATINGSRYMLVEFSFHGLSLNRVLRYTGEIQKMGFVPIIAHPERYAFMQENYDIVNFLVDSGALLQINASSLAGLGGIEEAELAYSMMRGNLVSFVGTDAHSARHRPNNLLALSRMFPTWIETETLEELLVRNPERLIANEDIPRSNMSPISRRRFF